MTAHGRGLRAGALATAAMALLATSFLVQHRFLQTYRQPSLFGDALAYHHVGERLREAATVWRDAGAVAAFERLRPIGPLAGVGAIYATLDAIWPGDEQTARIVFALLNSLAALAAFFLARSLAGSWAAGLLALALATLHPSFSVQTARLLPDPVTGCLWAWSAFLYAEGHRRGGRAWMVGAGLTLTAGLYVRSQLMPYVLGFAALGVLAAAPWIWRDRPGRRRLAWLVVGCLPIPLLWLASVRATRGDLSAIEQLGNFGYRQWYPYGFWQHLETDGWMGPYRLKTEPYYQALAARAEGDRDLLRSRGRQLAFTARYVASRPVQSSLTVLDNVYRTYDRPPNDYQVDYPYSYDVQVVAHRLVLLLGLAGMAVFCAARPGLAGAFLIPLSLAAIHGLAYPWPRFAQPALAIWIASAAAFLAWAIERARRFSFVNLALALLAGGSALAWSLRLLLRDSRPEAAHVLGAVATLVGLAIPFHIAGRLLGTARRWQLVASTYLGVALVVLGHTLHDRSWHGTSLVLDRDHAAEQEIDLSPEAVSRLRAAPEAFVVVDAQPLVLAATEGLTLELGGRPAVDLAPTLPRLGDSVVARWRPRWRERQWYAVPLDTTLLPPSGPARLRLTLRPRAGRWRLYGDRHSQQTTVYEGPSFGEWPRLAAVKLEYDGDYRLPARYRLQSRDTRSFVLDDAGRRPLRAVHRVRLITLANDGGYVRWRSAPPPGAGRAALAFAAYAGDRGSATLSSDGQARLSFPLAGGDFDVEGGGYHLCYRDEGRRGDKPYGAYFLIGPVESRAVGLEVRFRSGPSVEPMRFIVDVRRDLTSLAPLLARCVPPRPGRLVDGAERLLDASRNSYPDDTGRWTVAEVF